MASSALPYAAALFLLLAPPLASAESPISLPPTSAPTASPADERLHPDSTAALAPSQPPSEASAAALSPPAPPETSPLPAPSESPVPHSAAPAPSAIVHPAASAPAPSAANDKDKDKEERSWTPAPSPAAEEIKATGGGDKAVEEDRETERHGDELNGGKKAGVVVGAFSAAAVVGLAVFVWKKRQSNIRRSRYADYSARLELV